MHARPLLTLLCCVSALLLAGCEKPAPPAGGSGSPASPAPKAEAPERTETTGPALTVDIQIDSGPKRIAMEAEAGEVVEPMQVAEDLEASGGKYVITPEPPDNDHQTLGGETRLVFNVPEAGKYNIWLRVYWNHSCDNSFDVSVAGGDKMQVTNNTYKVWQWLQVGREPFALEAGPVPVVVTSREDDSKVDEVLLVQARADPKQDYVPTGIEKPE